MKTLEYKGIKGVVHYSVLDYCFLGKLEVDGLISFEAKKKEDLFSEFKKSVDEYLINRKITILLS